jgi:hypothetical protein
VSGATRAGTPVSDAARAGGAVSGARRWHSHAFGLALDSSFELAGCPASRAPSRLPRVRMELADRGSLRSALPAGSEMVAWRHGAAGEVVPEVIGHPDAGYLIDEGRLGVFHVSADATLVRCAVGGVATWRWQRYLVGSVLPFACTLRGLEPWHAGAVAWGGSAIVLAGESGRGKSTLVAELMLRGAQLLADDVIALELTASGVVGHPGPGLMSLRRSAVQRLGRSGLGRVGVGIGGDARAIRLAVPRHERPLPLASVYLLERAEPGEEARLTELAAPDPRRLLASTFNFSIHAPTRLVNQLEVCAAIARSVRVVRLALPLDADHGAVAEWLIASGGRVPGAAERAPVRQ